MSTLLEHPTAARAAAATDAPRTFPLVQFRALGENAEPGEFESIVAVFGNIDSYGDRIRLGAFTKTLKPPPEGRGLAPVVWTHDWQDPPIGVSLEQRELDLQGLKDAGAQVDDVPGLEGGLYSRGRFLVRDDEEHATARKVWAAMRAVGGDGRPPLREWSFGFRTRKAQWVEEDPDTLPPELQWTGGEIRDLLELDQYEYGPTLVGANDATETLATKSAILRLELRGLLTSAEARNMLGELPGTPDPGARTERRNREATAEVKARLSELANLTPPEAL